MKRVGSPYDLTPEELRATVAELGEPAYRARQIERWLDVAKVSDPVAMTDLPGELRSALAERWASTGLTLLRHQAGDGGWTHKFLFGLPGGDAVETVLMCYPPPGTRLPAGLAPASGGDALEVDDWEAAPPAAAPGAARSGAPPGAPGSGAAGPREAPEAEVRRGRATVCISTQAGCAMGCPFCATGQAGFTRNLTAGEVIEQVARVWAALPSLRPGPAAPDRITNVVFMGMGEPFANPTATFAAARRLHEGFGLSARSITISTVGLVPQIRRLAAEPSQFNLAISIHAADDELRSRLVPVNRTWPIEELLDAVLFYVAATRRRVSFEYALLAGVNDAPEQGLALGRLLAPLRLPAGGHAAHVNLIPLNPIAGGEFAKPARAAVARFQAAVASTGVPVSVRANRGVGIDAACGQLRSSEGRPGRRLPLFGPVLEAPATGGPAKAPALRARAAGQAMDPDAGVRLPVRGGAA